MFELQPEQAQTQSRLLFKKSGSFLMCYEISSYEVKQTLRL